MSDDWIDRLQAKLADGASDEVPKGWETTRQIAKRRGLSVFRIQQQMSDFVAAGLVERKQFRIVVNGQSRPVFHYRPKA